MSLGLCLQMMMTQEAVNQKVFILVVIGVPHVTVVIVIASCGCGYSYSLM